MEFGASVGLRVVRGPNWSWGDQDGGEGHVGTVVEVGQGGGSVVMVQWDCGNRCRYRCGEEGKYDLRVFDSAPTGLKHSDAWCNGCAVKGICGMLWKCIRCPDYHLCGTCYMAGKHSLEHPFDCILNTEKLKIRTPLRMEARRVVVRGLFPGAEVVRGWDWRFGNQDGKTGNFGKVLSLKGWQDQSARSIAEVQWNGISRKNIYRAGHSGKVSKTVDGKRLEDTHSLTVQDLVIANAEVDLKCEVPGIGGYYYPEHLPILGATCVAPGPKDFASGDKVKAELDMEVVTSVLEGGGGSDGMMDSMLELLDHVGEVIAILDSGELLVRYPNNNMHPVSPETVTKVDVPSYEVGDVVRVIDDLAETYRLQKGHGEWADDMALALGQVGVVIKEFSSGDVRVAVNGKRWTMNPCCLLPAPNDKSIVTPDTEEMDIGARLKLYSLMQGMGSDVVVGATAAGDASTLRDFLTSHPQEVNAKLEGKTAVHVAIEEAYIHILKLLLEFRPNLELEDGEGEKPLHTCAFVNQPEAAKLLLDAGANINCKNRKGNAPLMIAGAVGHYTLLAMLANHPKIDLQAEDIIGKTALHHAIATRRTKSVIILLDAGADPTFFNHRILAPIHDAAGFGFLPAIEELLRRNPQHVNFRRPVDGHVALHIAAVNNRFDVVSFLAQMNLCDINAKNDLMRTPLHMVAIEGHSRIIERLVGCGVELNSVDNDGNTPLHIVLIKKNAQPATVKTPQLIKVRDELLAMRKGDTPIDNHFVMACFLVQEGADVNIRNRVARTPIQLCSSEMSMLMMNFVNKSGRGSFHGSLRHLAGAELPENHGQEPGGQQVTKPTAQSTSSGSPKVPGPTHTLSRPSFEESPESENVAKPLAPNRPPMESGSRGSQAAEPPCKTNPVPKDGANATESCFLCDNPANVKFEPCGHCLMCSQCAEKAKRCPTCRVLIQSQVTLSM